MRPAPALLIALIALAACTPHARNGGDEDFARAFERMQAEPEFLASRIAANVRIVEALVRGDGTQERLIPCSVDEIARNGWHILPGAERLAATGTTYSSPERVDPGRLSVTLGPAEGNADARYQFALSGGRWRLAGVEVYTVLDAGEAAPPLPCYQGHGPDGSSGPTPLRSTG
jgi:hypothetical protein